MKSTPTWIMSLALAAGCGWLGASAFNTPTTGKEPRFRQLTMEQLNDQQRPVAEKIMKVSSVGLGGPYNPLLRSPVLA
jgi:4-carboxymuconolactone decarboxylase